MPTAGFPARLLELQRRQRSVLCVGLDPDPDRLPRHLLDSDVASAVIAFNRAIIEATARHAAAYKLNFAFFEHLGPEGWRVLEATLEAIPADAITVADGKRGDIGNSARFYAGSAFNRLGFDACTVSGYMGRDSVDPFLDYEGRCAFLLARTSNPGGADFQELVCDGAPLFERVVGAAARWDDDRPGCIGFVAGATDTDALRHIREIAPSAPLLIPGVGAQGGDIAAVMDALSTGDGPVLINSSRSILYASGGEDFAEAAEGEASSLRVRLEAGMEDAGGRRSS